jgi:hypothetical protein
MSSFRGGLFVVLRKSLISFVFLTLTAWAQDTDPHHIPECGKAKVHLANPQYLTTAGGIVAVELPDGWVLDANRKGVFYFLKRREDYNSARTLMYVNVEKREGSLERAVQKDRQSFQKNCDATEVRDLAKPGLLEQGCECRTQLFSCQRKQNPYVDLVTKISIDGLLLNVVLSADSASELSSYRKDYDFVLRHLTVVK